MSLPKTIPATETNTSLLLSILTTLMRLAEPATSSMKSPRPCQQINFTPPVFSLTAQSTMMPLPQALTAHSSTSSWKSSMRNRRQPSAASTPSSEPTCSRKYSKKYHLQHPERSKSTSRSTRSVTISGTLRPNPSVTSLPPSAT